MSILNNTTELQSLLNKVNTLPERSNLILQNKTVTPSTSQQIINADNGYDGLDTVTVNGDSNLVASNIKSGTSIFGVSGTYSGTGGNTDVEDSLINRTVTTYENNRVTSIGISAFAYCSSLTTVNFPACTTINNHAFDHCKNLTSISFPVCTSISYGAFSYCSSLTTADFPACTTIGASAFYNCENLTSISFPACTAIHASAFSYCSSLTTADFPVCTTISYGAFSGCSSLTTADFPACTTIGASAFYNCENLTSISFPACMNIGSYAFYDCENLTSISFPKCTRIGSNAFFGCCGISALTLEAYCLCTLKNSNALSNTPYTGLSTLFSGTPYIYVPASLVSSYKTATNWSYFSSYFSAIPGTEIDSGGLITFRLNGWADIYDYQAEKGMTWGEWCDSEYNTDGFRIENNYVVCDFGEFSDNVPLSTDIIFENGQYDFYDMM